MKLTKTMWVMLVISAVVISADFISTFSVGKVAKYLESNPIFLLTDSFLILIGANILFLIIFLFAYKKSKPDFRFAYVSYFCWYTLLRVAVVINNFKVAENPPTVEAAKQITTAYKQQSYFLSILPYLLPVVITYLSYLIFRLDHHVNMKSP